MRPACIISSLTGRSVRRLAVRQQAESADRMAPMPEWAAIAVEQAWAEPWMLTVFRQAGLHGTSVGGVTVYPTGYGEYNRVASAARA